MLGGELLMDDASIRDFNGGIRCHVASALEQTLLLPKDMVQLRGLRKNEVFLNAKRYWEWYDANSLLLSFFFLTYNYHAHILLVCYGTDLFSFRLSKPLSGLRR